MRWNYIVRQRHRWADDVNARQRQTKRLQRDLRKLGVNARHLKRIDGLVEVGVPDSDQDRFWEAKILPWEYVLAAASKPYRSGRNLLVVRHLKTGRRKRTRVPKSLAYVETAPDGLAESYDFSAERALVTGSLDGLESPTGILQNPTMAQLRERVSEISPDVIHVSGIDNRSGRQNMGNDLTGVRDGLFFESATGEPKEHRAEEIAKVLNLGSPNPIFIGFNCWDSGARLSPMAIHSGARASIGFQHTFDETVAEIFFLNFYRSCVRSGWNLLQAFCQAWDAIGPYRNRIRGSSIVLWSADSLVSRIKSDQAREWLAGSQEAIAHRPVSATPWRRADPSVDRVADLLQISVRPKPQLNYSSLHNGESLFDQLTIRLDPAKWSASDVSGDQTVSGESEADRIQEINDLEMKVELHVGADSYPYRSRVNLSNKRYRYDFERDVRLPLTGKLFRTISERILTSLFVEVTWHDQVLYRQTHSVWLAPIDQWTLEDRQIGWLPSFVQPRDPAVAATINAAHGYLQCLADNVGVGFDGYQSYNGSASGLARWAGVDRQAQSIWAALLLGSNLNYINPPPSYAQFTQRLRTPSDTVGGGFGTCVDLAILFASCLEWVEIHPVLFMLHGHVFPGYWKDLAAHRRFIDVLTDRVPVTDRQDELPRDDTRQRWVSGEKTYSEIKGLVDRGELVPIETVGLTQGMGFTDAIDAGRDHFYKKRSRAFRAMIDLVSARQGSSVTPLPLFFSAEIDHAD